MCQCPATHDGAEEESYSSACLDFKEVHLQVSQVILGNIETNIPPICNRILKWVLLYITCNIE